MRFISRTYLKPILDYSSQLYSLCSEGSLVRLESLLESFSSKIEGLENSCYWDRLQSLKVYSITRRFERYKMIYCMKILNQETQNCGLTWNYSKETGYQFNIPKFGNFYTNERRQSFNYMGPSLFNSLPLYLRKELLHSSVWKVDLDKFLELIPDNPITLKISSGLSDIFSGKPTNSLLRWIPHLGLMGRRKAYPPD